VTTKDQLAFERRGALSVVRAIVAMRHPRRTVAVDLALGMAEHEARKVVQDYTRQLAAPEPRELPLDVEAETEGVTR
jgi:hypothetical protein